MLILGATSTIARAVAAAFAARGHALLLAGRSAPDLEAEAADLHLRYGVAVRVCLIDALDCQSHGPVLDAALAALDEPLAGAVVAIGYLGDQTRAQSDWDEARRILDTNFTACVSLSNHLANRLAAQGSGFLCVLASVAGDRGRQSNYLYGAAKGGLSIYLQGLRNRLHGAGVRVITIKPGFVDTPMTFGRPGLFLVASPAAAGRGIYRAVARGRDVAYVPGFWWGIMLIIRSIPERVFKRLHL